MSLKKYPFIVMTLLLGSLNSNDGPLKSEPILELPSAISINVILDASQKVEIYPEIFEEVESIPFRLGQSFKKGDLLLKMKNQFYKSQVEKAYFGVQFAKEDLSIKESLYKSNLISTLELLQAELGLATALNQYDEAERNYQATMITAPFDGKIGSMHAREYERPIRQKTLMEIFNDSKITARFIIPSHLLPKFAIGETISIFVKDLNKNLPAKITLIGAEINPVSSTVNLEAEMNNGAEGLMPGMASFLEIRR